MTGELLIREMHDSDKPRERLINYGPDKLTNQELLAILINTGNRNESSISLASKILKNLQNVLKRLNIMILMTLTKNVFMQNTALKRMVKSGQ